MRQYFRPSLQGGGVDCRSRQGYKVLVVMALCERWECVSGSRCPAGILLVSFRQPPRVVFYTEKSNISYTISQAENDPRALILHKQYVDAAACGSL